MRIYNILKKIQTEMISVLLLVITLTGCGQNTDTQKEEQNSWTNKSQEIQMDAGVNVDSLEDIPEYDGENFVTVNDNHPDFTDEEMTTEPFEEYSPLDSLGRCGSAYANVCTDIMPTEEREAIGLVKPSGWHTVKYNGIVDGNYLYNRCHLIGYQLSGENSNNENLITGTRWMNVQGMLPFENMVAEYVEETDNHVLYRVTPVFEGDNLVADGVQMEAKSVEDDGEAICFNVFVFNIQPGIEIDYETGDSQIAEEYGEEEDGVYIANENTKKFHEADCSSVSQISEKNKKELHVGREQLIEKGYTPCQRCNP